jgi:DNA-binding response OmpR family regulator
MALALVIGMRRKKERFTAAPVQENKTEETDGSIQLGRIAFNPQQLSLSLDGQQQSLTVKEAKLLVILAESANQVVDRNRLQKEVWEDEGVIVGRSLDMFISRLRKKLEGDAAVKIVSVHGKGYRLEIPETTI